MSHLLCVLSKFNLHYGLPWKRQDFIYIAKNEFFIFFFLEDITHLVVQSEQFGSHRKLSWEFMVR